MKDRLSPTIRYDVTFDSDSIRNAGFAKFFRIRQSAFLDENAVQQTEFLNITVDKARAIFGTEFLYVD